MSSENSDLYSHLGDQCLGILPIAHRFFHLKGGKTSLREEGMLFSYSTGILFHMRALIIEDDKKIAAALSRALRAESYAVDVAGDGITGEELAKTNDYDAIILDILLPRQDGWQTCANLRRDKILAPILILSALDGAPDKIKGLDHGADDYLAKPFHTGELLARIRSLTRRRSEVRTSVLEHFGLKLDLATHRASREGKEVSLTAKEFALLELFMMHPRKILTREMISEHLWDMNFDPRSNVIESFVKYLRQKIDRGFGRGLIHTIRGSGYMFSDIEP
jgi:two-component system copper resistance phosphate regulon response regulator CusR